ncbi:MAG: glycerophosphoryl diester phosphodiesterase membrane domain-containing protein [Bacilli bacterium]
MDKHNKRIIKNTYANFRWNIKVMAMFQIAYKLITLFLIVPINYFIIQQMLYNEGMTTVANADLITFGLQPSVIVGLIVILVISFVAIFIEMGVLTYIARKSHEHQTVTLTEAVVNSFRALPKKPSVHSLLLVFLAGFIGPLTGIGLYSSLITEFTIPPFIKDTLFRSPMGTGLFVLFLIAMLTLLLRWILVIPASVIEDVRLKEAFSHSVNIYKREKWRFAKYFSLWVVVNMFIRALFFVGYVSYFSSIFKRISENTIFGETLFIFSILLFLIGYMAFSVLTLPLFVSFITEFYYVYRNYNVKERTFKEIPTSDRWIKSRKSLSFGVVIAFILIVGFFATDAVENSILANDISITAHRGSSDNAPENSRASVALAMKEGADFAEIDVMSTKDEEVVLFHDATLSRIAGRNEAIKDLNLEAVIQIDNGSHFSSDYQDERIPPLRDIFDMVRGKMNLNIELKPYGPDDPLPKLVADLIREYDMSRYVVVSSLDARALKKFKRHNRETPVGYIYSFGLGDFSTLDVDFISMEYSRMNRELVYRLQTVNKQVHVWTLNDRKHIEDAIQLNVDNIITDHVRTTKDILEREKQNAIRQDYYYRFIKAIEAITTIVKI